MNMKDFLLGVATGLAAAIVVKEVSTRVAPYQSSDAVLANIKNEFKKQAPIDSSWIYMKPESYSNGFTEIPVYRGGISRILDGQVQNFEFKADARSGGVVELVEV